MENKNRKILFITDSLGLPRAQPELVPDDATWTYVVSKRLKEHFDFFYYTVAGLHTGMLVQSLKFQAGAFRPDLIVLQIGIVDCAPRALKENERKVIQRLPGFISKVLLGFVRRNYHYLIRKRKISYVSLFQFENNLIELRNFFKRSQFLVVPIAPANTAYIESNPLISNNIKEYNKVLTKVFGEENILNVWEGEDPELLFLSDNHHLSVSGNAVLGQGVNEFINTNY
ncbi:MAG: SGNH/GDSL hydrolase family protein [Aestuariibacter sp.]